MVASKQNYPRGKSARSHGMTLCPGPRDLTAAAVAPGKLVTRIGRDYSSIMSPHRVVMRALAFAIVVTGLVAIVFLKMGLLDDHPGFYLLKAERSAEVSVKRRLCLMHGCRDAAEARSFCLMHEFQRRLLDPDCQRLPMRLRLVQTGSTGSWPTRLGGAI